MSNCRTRNPQWVLERVNRNTVFGEGNRIDSKFKEDSTIPARLRNRLEDFKYVLCSSPTKAFADCTLNPTVVIAVALSILRSVDLC